MKRVFVLAILAVSLAHAQPQTSGYWPAEQWRTASPASQGLDENVLANLVRRIRSGEFRDLDSLLIVRNGHMVVEEYFNGSLPSIPHTLQSDTKSVASLLTGIAIAQGKIPGVGEKVLPFFPEYPDLRNLDQRKASLRIDDLLTMRTGRDWSEIYSGNPLEQLNQCNCDWLRFVLDWPMRESPSSRWEYDSGGVILLGGLIRHATGRMLQDFAQQNLFDPLGIQGAWWYTGRPDNLPHSGGGLNLRPQDMARIGYLVLRNGRWKERQIVARDWLATSFTRHVRLARTFANRWTDYGYLWWILPVDGMNQTDGTDADIYFAAGAMDQWIFVVPKYDLVVVVTGHTSTTFGQPVSFLYSDILRAIADRPLSAASAASADIAAVAPDSIATIRGASLTDATVTIRDSEGLERSTSITYSSADQINCVIPPGVAPGFATISAVSADGQISVGRVEIRPVTPGIFMADPGAKLAAAAVVSVGPDGSREESLTFRYDASTGKHAAEPISLGTSFSQQFLILYATGLRARSSLQAVTATIGGEPARVDYAGPQCCHPGLDQINLLIPKNLTGRGDVEIALQADGVRSNPVHVTIR